MIYLFKYSCICILIIVFSACSNTENKKIAHKLKHVERLKELSNDWKLVHSVDSLSGSYLLHAKNGELRTGEHLLLEFLQAKYIDYVEFRDNGVNNCVYKLYLDNRYAGKYETNKRVSIKKRHQFIRITLAKKGKERVVEGWDRNYDYVFIKDTLKYSKIGQKLIISLPQCENIILRPNSHRRVTTNIESDFINKHNTLILRGKKNEFFVEQSTDFKIDGTFFVNYLKVDKKSKKIIYEYFLHGNWKLINRFRNRTKIELDGILSGKPDEKVPHNVSAYKKQIVIDSLNIIKSNDFLDGIMLDLPNWVMVNLGQFNNNFIIDIPYSTTKNITGIKLYECNECYLLYQTVKDLLRVQEIFEKMELKLKLLDCYRPYDVQKILYDAFPVSGYVADPVGGSIHNRGTAVDLTLVDATGNELDMGSEYDELSIRSNHGYIGFADTVLQNRKLLRETMNSCDFVTIRLEWWHYNHQYARKYPKLNDSFPCYETK